MAPFPPSFDVKNEPTEVIAFPSGVEMYAVDPANAFGFLEDLLRIFSKDLNFVASRYQRVDGTWGAFDNDTGEWDGHIQSIVTGDVDLSWSALTMTADRSRPVSFLLPYQSEHLCVVSKESKNELSRNVLVFCGLRAKDQVNLLWECSHSLQYHKLFMF